MTEIFGRRRVPKIAKRLSTFIYYELWVGRGIPGDGPVLALAAGGEEVEEVLAISVAEENSLTVVAALSDVQPVAGGSETVLAWHEGLQ